MKAIRLMDSQLYYEVKHLLVLDRLDYPYTDAQHTRTLVPVCRILRIQWNKIGCRIFWDCACNYHPCSIEILGDTCISYHYGKYNEFRVFLTNRKYIFQTHLAHNLNNIHTSWFHHFDARFRHTFRKFHRYFDCNLVYICNPRIRRISCLWDMEHTDYFRHVDGYLDRHTYGAVNTIAHSQRDSEDSPHGYWGYNQGYSDPFCTFQLLYSQIPGHNHIAVVHRNPIRSSS